MPTGVATWSQNASQNDVADSGVNWREGQAPSSVNDSARAMMASTAKWRDDIAGAVLVTGGTSTAYTLNTNQVFAGNNNGNTVQFTPGVTNTGAVTLAADGQTPLPLRFLTGVDLPSGVVISGSLYQATLRAGEWLLHASPASTPFLIPIGGLIDFVGSTAPNSNFILPQGQAISIATYATLFSICGTTFNTGGEPVGTFRVPDLVGRVTAMIDASAARLTASYFGTTAVLGATGGFESTALVNNNLPPYTPAGSLSISNGGITVSNGGITVSNGGITVSNGAITITNGTITIANLKSATSVGDGSHGAFSYYSDVANQGTVNTNPSQATTTASQGTTTASQATTTASQATTTGTFSGAAQNGISAPFRTVPPMAIVNKLLRAL